MSISQLISKKYLNLKFEDLPQEVIHAAKSALLDTLGCGIGGFDCEPKRIMETVIEELGAPQECTLIGSGKKTSVFYATLTNGIMVRYLDFNDSYFVPIENMLAGSHPSDLFAGALAVAEKEKVSGKDFISAVVAGYDVSGRIIEGQLKRPINDRGWENDCRGVYVMPVVTGKLLKINENQMINAIGISGSQNMLLGILDADKEPITMMKSLRFALTSQSGIFATYLARRGFTGPIRVIEGDKGFVESVFNNEFDLTTLTKDDGRFRIVDRIAKYFCSCGTSHGYLGCVLDIVKEKNLYRQDIESVKIMTSIHHLGHCADPTKRYPENKETADHSAWFQIAAIIIDRELTPFQYTSKKYKDPIYLEMMEKIKLEHSAEFDSYGSAGEVEIITKKGDVFRKKAYYRKGDPKNPMSDQEMEDKFRVLASLHMKDNQINQIIDLVWNFEKCTNVEELMKLMVFKK